MRSRSAVFHNRFIVVHPFYNPDDPSTFESDRARASPRLRDERRVRREDRLQLVLERQQLQAQQIQTLQVSLRRRQELLAWTQEELGRYIIEDDYDSEFRFSKRPVPSIQSMDKNHRVIYFNTFSKTLAPSIRISYMVLPPALMDRYVGTMNFYACTVSAFEQYALTEFMHQGYFDRHIHRMKNFYRNKRDKILEVLKASPLYKQVEILEKGAGNHFLMRINTDLSDTQLKWAAAGNGIQISCLSEYCESDKDKYAHILIVNYSDLEENGFRTAVEVLSQIVS